MILKVLLTILLFGWPSACFITSYVRERNIARWKQNYYLDWGVVILQGAAYLLVSILVSLLALAVIAIFGQLLFAIWGM